MPYCRRCGAQLEENAHFCHKCGTQMLTLSSFSPRPMPLPTSKKSSTKEIVLVAVLITVAIAVASIFAYLALNSVGSSQTNSRNQTNVTNLAFRLPPDGIQTTRSLMTSAYLAGKG